MFLCLFLNRKMKLGRLSQEELNTQTPYMSIEVTFVRCGAALL